MVKSFKIGNLRENIIWFILVIGFILRIINLDQSLWLDEATQALLSNKSISEIFYNRSADFHPPLSYILSHFWQKISFSEIWLRILPVLFGVGTIYGIYIFGIKLSIKKVALLSAFLLSIAPYHIYYSQEYRMYSMTTFFTVLSMYFFISSQSKWNLVGYIISTSALIYSHYMGLFLILAQLIYLIFLKKELIRRFLVSIFFVLLLYLPWIPQLFIQFKSGMAAEEYLPGWSQVLSLSWFKSLPLTFLKFSIGRIDFENTFIYLVIALLVFIIFGFLFLKGIIKTIKDKNYLPLFWLIIPILLAFFISFQTPLNQPFRLLFIIPAFHLFLAVGLTEEFKFKRILFSLVLILTIGGLFTYYLNPVFHRENWRGAVNYVDNNQGLSLFVWPEPFAPYLWYSQKKEGIGVAQKLPISNEELAKNQLFIENKSRVYLFEYLQDLSDPSRKTQLWLEGLDFEKSQTLNFNGVGLVYEYNKKI